MKINYLENKAKEVRPLVFKWHMREVEFGDNLKGVKGIITNKSLRFLEDALKAVQAGHMSFEKNKEGLLENA